ncbi:hypothetical protein PoB_003085300 [Plakobranchus ocellatus]|uniref:Uncharacterized protein n=1 Tax=Plakobranchus ocellatus TaxID=259542 RepID=A0AAV4ACS9_9GAST|nr:hypothetical protein PoB_003085300 [Plakobranchus ocellatus]
MVSRIMRCHVMAPLFPSSNKATDVRQGCKTQRITPALRQVADLVRARTKEREYFQTCIVGHVNCCLQCGSTLTRDYDVNSAVAAQGSCGYIAFINAREPN